MIHELKTTYCPYCGQHADRAINVDEFSEAPSTGDYTICIRCGTILRYDQYMLPRFLDSIGMKDLAEMDFESFIAVKEAQQRIRNRNGVKLISPFDILIHLRYGERLLHRDRRRT